MRSPRQYPGQTPAYPCILIGNSWCLPRHLPGQPPVIPGPLPPVSLGNTLGKLLALIGNGKCHEKGRWHKTDAFVGKNACILFKRDTHIFAVFGALPNRCRKIMGSGPGVSPDGLPRRSHRQSPGGLVDPQAARGCSRGTPARHALS